MGAWISGIFVKEAQTGEGGTMGSDSVLGNEHHVPGGGFVNPWPSIGKNMGFLDAMKMIFFVSSFSLFSFLHFQCS